MPDLYQTTIHCLAREYERWRDIPAADLRRLAADWYLTHETDRCEITASEAFEGVLCWIGRGEHTRAGQSLERILLELEDYHREQWKKARAVYLEDVEPRATWMGI